MVGCVEGILGMRPDFYGLHLSPAIPHEWEEFEVNKVFRGCQLHIVVKNPGHVQSGMRQTTCKWSQDEEEIYSARSIEKADRNRIVYVIRWEERFVGKIEFLDQQGSFRVYQPEDYSALLFSSCR